MPRKITIITPENVRIDYEIAGIASRCIAAFVDHLLQLGLLGVLYAMRYLAGKYIEIPVVSWGVAIIGIAAFVINYGYYLYFETVWNGQTPGKRFSRTRTVREGGVPIDLSCAALRNLIRVVDFLPVLYILGGITVLISSCNKRLGDYAAGTLVVKERTEWMGNLNTEGTQNVQPAPESEYVRNIELVSSEDFATISRFLDRQVELEKDIREQLAARIAAPIIAKLGIEDDGRIRYPVLLAEIHRRCIEERGMR
jgi:uncharacterized RDD family membrane protein YckC